MIVEEPSCSLFLRPFRVKKKTRRLIKFMNKLILGRMIVNISKQSAYARTNADMTLIENVTFYKKKARGLEKIA